MYSKDLSEEDKIIIIDKFEREIVPKLIIKLQGRIGVLNCGFAGKKYEKWNLIFRAKGNGFEIIDFEYDEESIELDLK